MAEFDVYGIGNALLDIEYEVTAEQLKELGIEKGVMTLVDEPQQTLIVNQLGSHESGRGSGGSAANTIIAVCQLGGSAFFSGRVANDETGTFYLQDLANAGVATSVQPQSSGITGKCLVLVTPDADRTMNTFLGVSADVASEDVDAAAIGKSEYTYIEGYLVAGPSSRSAAVQAAQQARAQGSKVAFTLSDPNIVHFFRPAIEELLEGGVDLLFANEDEALRLAETDDLQTAIAHLKTVARQFVVTRGAHGAVAFDGEMENAIDSVPTEAIDTVGAGDMFAGAFLYAITQGRDFAEAGRLASLAGSRIVSNMGPRLKAAQMQEVLQQFRS